MQIKVLVAEQAKQKAHREGRTINKNVIAEEAGIPWNTVDKYWENQIQRYDKDVLLALCKYFECEISDLLVIVADPDGMAVAQPFALATN